MNTHETPHSDDQHLYDIVAEELQRKVLRAGLWARAVAETGGEGDAARARYIRLRVKELARIEEQIEEQERIAKQEEAEARRRAEEQIEEQERIAKQEEAEARRRAEESKRSAIGEEEGGAMSAIIHFGRFVGIVIGYLFAFLFVLILGGALVSGCV